MLSEFSAQLEERLVDCVIKSPYFPLLSTKQHTFLLQKNLLLLFSTGINWSANSFLFPPLSEVPKFVSDIDSLPRRMTPKEKYACLPIDFIYGSRHTFSREGKRQAQEDHGMVEFFFFSVSHYFSLGGRRGHDAINCYGVLSTTLSQPSEARSCTN